MPGRKSAAAPAKSTRQINATSKPAEVKPTQPASKPLAKSNAHETKAKEITTTIRTKRKAEDEVEKHLTNGVKRPRGKRESSPAAKPEKRAAPAEPKEATPVPVRARPGSNAAAKKPKTSKAKQTINQAPAQRLNVYVFGVGEAGELGLGSAKGQSEVKRPRLNPLLAADKIGVVQLAVGGMHTAALTHDNRILTWGVNDQGALGRDTTWDGGLRDVDMDNDSDDDDSSSGAGDINPHESTPTEMDTSSIPEGVVFTQLACTDSATFALTDEGLVYGCGTFRSNEGIFGFSSSAVIEPRLVLVTGLKKIIKMSCGANHVLALASDGAVYAWGSGQQNQLGRRILERHQISSLTPTQFGFRKGIVDIGTGSYHSFAIHQNGDVYSWGLNSFGETGIPKPEEEDAADVHHPEIIKSLRGKGRVTCIEGGAHHTIAVTDKGECLVWGRLDAFQTGIKIDTLPREDVVCDSHNHPRILIRPTQIPGINAVWATAGPDHCLAITQDGKAYAWGFSTTYQTGLGTDEDVEVATQIDNTAVRGKKLVWAGAGGQFSVIAGKAEEPLTNGVNGHA